MGRFENGTSFHIACNKDKGKMTDGGRLHQ